MAASAHRLARGGEAAQTCGGVRSPAAASGSVQRPQQRASLCTPAAPLGSLIVARHIAASACVEPAPQHHGEPGSAQAPAAGALSSGASSPSPAHHGKQLPKSPQRRAVAAAVAAEPLAPLRNLPFTLPPPPPIRLDAPALRTGRVDLIVGPMFAGKTTELILRAREAQAAGHRVLVLKSSKDNRYDKQQHLVTHNGDLLPCLAVHDLAHVPDARLAESDVVAIDEAQFFADLVSFVHRAADHMHKTVLVAGLDGDFKRGRFGQVLDLVPLADSVLKLHTRCHHVGCLRPAIFSMRITADTAQELVGGADKYMPACRVHYRGPAPEPHQAGEQQA